MLTAVTTGTVTDEGLDRAARVAWIVGLIWGAAIGGLAGWRGDLSDTLSVVAGACGAGVAIVCTMVMTGAGLVRGLGQGGVRVVARGLLPRRARGLHARAHPAAPIARAPRVHGAYQRRFPDASQVHV